MSIEKNSKKRLKNRKKKLTLAKSNLWILFFLIPIFGALWYFSGVREKEPSVPQRPPEGRPALKAYPETMPQEPPPRREPEELPLVAVIIDDVGLNMHYFDDLLNIKAPITLSVLPNRPFTQESIQQARQKGLEILMHLPMEPDDYPFSNPGKDAVFSFMSDDQIEEVVEKGLRSVPCAVGVNNHMGSRITKDPRIMKTVIEVLKRHHLFYIDSRTTSETLACDLAREMGLRADSREVFLDAEPGEELIKSQVNLLIGKAKKKGYAIGIGHKQRNTVHVLEAMLPTLESRGVRPVFCSELPTLSASPISP